MVTLHEGKHYILNNEKSLQLLTRQTAVRRKAKTDTDVSGAGKTQSFW